MVKHRRQRLDVDGDVRGAPRSSERAVGVREQHDRLLGVVDDAVGEARLVVGDERDARCARGCPRR